LTDYHKKFGKLGLTAFRFHDGRPGQFIVWAAQQQEAVHGSFNGSRARGAPGKTSCRFATYPDDKSSGSPQQHPSFIIGGNLTVISLINMLLIKVDNSILQ